jgi:hypothetical protein
MVPQPILGFGIKNIKGKIDKENLRVRKRNRGISFNPNFMTTKFNPHPKVTNKTKNICRNCIFTSSQNTVGLSQIFITPSRVV